MRPLEWLVFGAFVPAIVLLFAPQQLRERWLFAVSLLLPLATILHLIIEGWRIQMVPLYLLALCMLVGGALQRRVAFRRFGLPARLGATLILAFGGLLAGWLLPVVRLPEPSGPYPVGIVDRELLDQARGRRLMVSVWYPAAQGGPPALLTKYPDQLMTGLARLGALPALVFQHLRYVSLAASDGVPVLAGNRPFPVLVFSHGLVGLRLQNSSTFQELVSWGYIVVALDHTDAAAVTVFPDGEVRYYNSKRFGIPSGVEPDIAMVDERIFPAWVADQRFVYDTLETWAVNDPLLAGSLDLERIGSFGHSFGGATALEVCRVEPRCRAAVNLDGGLYGDSVHLPAVRPIMLISSAESGGYPEPVEEWRQLVAQASGPAYWLELPNSSHLSFTFSQLLSPLLVPEGFEPRNGLRVVDKYLRAFFDLHLRDIETQLLTPKSGETDMHWK